MRMTVLRCGYAGETDWEYFGYTSVKRQGVSEDAVFSSIGSPRLSVDYRHSDGKIQKAKEVLQVKPSEAWWHIERVACADGGHVIWVDPGLVQQKADLQLAPIAFIDDKNVVRDPPYEGPMIFENLYIKYARDYRYVLVRVSSPEEEVWLIDMWEAVYDFTSSEWGRPAVGKHRAFHTLTAALAAVSRISEHQSV